MDNRSTTATEFLVFGVIAAAAGLVLLRMTDGGAPTALGWVLAVAGGLLFHAGLIGRVRN